MLFLLQSPLNEFNVYDWKINAPAQAVTFEYSFAESRAVFYFPLLLQATEKRIIKKRLKINWAIYRAWIFERNNNWAMSSRVIEASQMSDSEYV